jgi:sulfatase maturation enzyme AslB (radical SAM superfamily)
VAESNPFILGNIHDGGPDPQKAVEILRRTAERFTNRCPDCIFCRLCVGCIVEFADTSGDFSEAAIDAFCREQIAFWSRTIRDWSRALEKNPACFDYMEKRSIV